MVTKILVNIGSDNGLLPDGTKPLSEQMLKCDQILQFLKSLAHLPGASELNDKYPMASINDLL